MASATAVTSIPSTAQAANTFITSTVMPPTSTLATSAISTTVSASPSASAASKSSSRWNNLNLLIFAPLVGMFMILGCIYYGGRLFPKLRLNSWKWKKAMRDGWNSFLALCYDLVNFVFYRAAIKSTKSGQLPQKPSKARSESISQAWSKTAQGIKNIAADAKSTTTNAKGGLLSLPFPSWPSWPAKKPKRPVIVHHFDLSPDKHNTQVSTHMPEDPFPDASTIASLSIHEEPVVLSIPDAVHTTRWE